MISLIPVVGDVTDASLNYFLVVRKARGADLPQWLVRRMMLNNAVSLAVSFVPFVGDVILAIFKANSRNAALLEEFLRVRGEEYLRLHPESEVTEATPSRKKSGGWFKSKKGQAGLTKKDAEQVKPGSGVQPGRVHHGCCTRFRGWENISAAHRMKKNKPLHRRLFPMLKGTSEVARRSEL